MCRERVPGCACGCHAGAWHVWACTCVPACVRVGSVARRAFLQTRGAFTDPASPRTGVISRFLSLLAAEMTQVRRLGGALCTQAGGRCLASGRGLGASPGCVSDQFERLACWDGWGFSQTGESVCEGLGAPATGHLEEMKRPPVGWSPRVPCLGGVPPGLVCVCASPSLTSGGVTVLGSGDREFAGYNSNTTHESAQAVRAAQGGYWSCFAATPGPRKGRVEPPSETSVLTVSRPHEAFTHSLLHLIA